MQEKQKQPEVPATRVGCISCSGELKPITVKEQGALVGVMEDKVIAQVCMNPQCPLQGLLSIIGRVIPSAPPESEPKA